MCLQVQRSVPPQFHILLNHFLHTCALKIKRTNATQVQHEVYLLLQPRVHLFGYLYIDLKVHL